MEKNWIKIYTSINYFRAEMVKQILTEHQIDAVLMNKLDSAHRTFGAVDVYVHEDNFSDAIEVMVMRGEIEQ